MNPICSKRDFTFVARNISTPRKTKVVNATQWGAVKGQDRGVGQMNGEDCSRVKWTQETKYT